MSEVYFPAVIEPSADGFGVWFPNFDGCVSAGDSFGETWRNATEALSLHLEGMAEEGQSIPDSTEEIAEDLSIPAGARVVMVRTEGPGKVVRANVTFEENLLRRIDRAAETADMTRSGWLAKVAREAMT